MSCEKTLKKSKKNLELRAIFPKQSRSTQYPCHSFCIINIWNIRLDETRTRKS